MTQHLHTEKLPPWYVIPGPTEYNLAPGIETVDLEVIVDFPQPEPEPEDDE